jgi:hypothetical protein
LIHPDEHYLHWRANASNLLFMEFLGLIRKHLNAGGIEYYNTTWSNEVQATGASAFPYALRIAGFLAVSDRPFTLDKQRWRTALASYTTDGRLVFDPSDPLHRSKLEELLRRPDGMLESREGILARGKGLRLITDNNMGTEWK